MKVNHSNAKQTLANKLNYVDRCLAMVMHYEEVQLIAEAIKEVISESDKAQATEGDR